MKADEVKKRIKEAERGLAKCRACFRRGCQDEIEAAAKLAYYERYLEDMERGGDR